LINIRSHKLDYIYLHLENMNARCFENNEKKITNVTIINIYFIIFLRPIGTYFNCIMFMVASSVVSTIMILNYHHRNADTHVMSKWVIKIVLLVLHFILYWNINSEFLYIYFFEKKGSHGVIIKLYYFLLPLCVRLISAVARIFFSGGRGEGYNILLLWYFNT